MAIPNALSTLFRHKSSLHVLRKDVIDIASEAESVTFLVDGNSILVIARGQRADDGVAVVHLASVVMAVRVFSCLVLMTTSAGVAVPPPVLFVGRACCRYSHRRNASYAERLLHVP